MTKAASSNENTALHDCDDGDDERLFYNHATPENDRPHAILQRLKGLLRPQ